VFQKNDGMIDFSKIKAVFFDMDGVLYDSMKNHETTWVECLKTAGITFPPEEAYLNEGKTGLATIAYAFEKYLGKTAGEEEKKEIYAYKTKLMADAPTAQILPGMQELLKLIQQKGMTTIVVTGSKQPTLVNKLSTDFNVPPNHIVSGADVKIGKPHPEPYLMAISKSGFNANNCLVVENAPMGIQSSKAANIYTVAVNTGILNNQVLLDAGADELFNGTLELFENWKKQLQ